MGIYFFPWINISLSSFCRLTTNLFYNRYREILSGAGQLAAGRCSCGWGRRLRGGFQQTAKFDNLSVTKYRFCVFLNDFVYISIRMNKQSFSLCLSLSLSLSRSLFSFCCFPFSGLCVRLYTGPQIASSQRYRWMHDRDMSRAVQDWEEYRDDNRAGPVGYKGGRG